VYNKYFGMRERPFHVTPDPRFFYPSLIGQEAYASLLYGINERKGFVVLTGEVGTGKTTLLRRLMLSVADTVCFALLYNTTWTFDEILDAICHDFSLVPLGSGRRFDKIQVLNSFLLEQFARGITTTLLIDEAHNLSVDVLENLRLLSNLETTSEKLLQIILVGQNELEAKLMLPELRQVKDRVAIWSRLDRLKEREVGPFIIHRLQVAGYGQHDLFTPEAIHKIATYSQGSPRQINIICDNALLIAYGTYQNQVSSEIIDEVALDLGLDANKIRGNRKPASGGEIAGVSKTTRSLQVRETPNPSIAPMVSYTGENWGDENSGEKPQTFHSWRERSIVNQRILLLTLFMSLIGISVFQFSRVEIAGSNSLVSRSMEIVQTQLIPAKPGSLTQSVNTPPTLHTVGDASEQNGKAFQQMPEASAHTQPIEKPSSQDSRPMEMTVAAISSGQQESEPQQNSKGFTALLNQERRTESKNLGTVGQTGQFVTVTRGLTIISLVSRLYGDHSILALDLIKESNPQINDLDKVPEGERIWIPPLTKETLLRRQADGSYRLIGSSFRKRREAEHLLQTLLTHGYSAVVSLQQVSSSLGLYRVEVEGLQNADIIEKVWKIVFPEDPSLFIRSMGKVRDRTETAFSPKVNEEVVP